ncbi:hypothetical protein [Sphingosinicella terrae]|uniref:hypothetical protein n=1 Tax=Sphingosinicella terrae TaxID=2172047 RepID=UPI000E0DD3CC|nr:hypothetical protein [Sphingosinicella terrae]
MNVSPAAAAAGLALALSACTGGGDRADNTADALEAAADQSSPAAANVLDNAAEQVREHNITDPAAAQEALEAAGNAQAPATPPAMNGQ